MQTATYVQSRGHIYVKPILKEKQLHDSLQHRNQIFQSKVNDNALCRKVYNYIKGIASHKNSS
jgi:hypothetical protein